MTTSTPARGGRPTRTLLERVLDRSFRPERYGHLLAEQLLPEQLPAELAGADPAYAAKAWEALRDCQQWYLLHDRDEPRDLDERRALAREFSWLVHHLHGGRRPAWFAERLGADA